MSSLDSNSKRGNHEFSSTFSVSIEDCGSYTTETSTELFYCDQNQQYSCTTSVEYVHDCYPGSSAANTTEWSVPTQEDAGQHQSCCEYIFSTSFEDDRCPPSEINNTSNYDRKYSVGTSSINSSSVHENSGRFLVPDKPKYTKVNLTVRSPTGSGSNKCFPSDVKTVIEHSSSSGIKSENENHSNSSNTDWWMPTTNKFAYSTSDGFEANLQIQFIPRAQQTDTRTNAAPLGPPMEDGGFNQMNFNPQFSVKQMNAGMNYTLLLS